MAGLEMKVDMLNKLAEDFDTNDIPTMKAGIQRGDNPTEYKHCPESTADRAKVIAQVQELEEWMEKPHRCFHILQTIPDTDHKVDCLGCKRNDGWTCRGYDGGCKSGITARGQTFGMERFRCKDCGYDLCRKCYDLWCTSAEAAKDNDDLPTQLT